MESVQGNLFSFSAVPEELVPVLELVQSRKGKANAIPVAAITRETGIPDRKARDMVKQLVEIHHYPIGSCPAGFFMAETEAEILECYRTLLSWAFSVLVRAKAFKKNSRLDEVLGQLKFELDPGASQ